MVIDLVARHLIILVAYHLACAWIQSFQLPWPLPNAFVLADSAEDQLFDSLGIKLESVPFVAKASALVF